MSTVFINKEKQEDCELGSPITIHIPWPVTAGGDYAVVRVHDGVVQAIPQGEDNAVDGEFFTVDAAAGEIVLRANKFFDYAIGATPMVEVSLPAGVPGVTYAVSNLTAGVEIPASSTMAGGASYMLPVGAKVAIYAVPAPGYEITGENPYVIAKVKKSTTVSPSRLPTVSRTSGCGETCGFGYRLKILVRTTAAETMNDASTAAQVGKALPAKGGKVKFSGGWAEATTVDIGFGK